MDILEQAREVGQRLRKSPDFVDPEEAADTIAALRAENEILADSCAAKADRIDRLGETVERLRAELEAAQVDLARYQWVKQRIGVNDEGVDAARFLKRDDEAHTELEEKK